MSYNRDPALLTFFNSFGNHAPGGTKITFNGYYIYATGVSDRGIAGGGLRHIPDEFNSPGNDNVKQIKILNPLRAGGWGAWELAARFSQINLNDGTIGFAQPEGSRPNIQGGREADFTLGLNWVSRRWGPLHGELGPRAAAVGAFQPARYQWDPSESVRSAGSGRLVRSAGNMTAYSLGTPSARWRGVFPHRTSGNFGKK